MIPLKVNTTLTDCFTKMIYTTSNKTKCYYKCSLLYNGRYVLETYLQF